MLVKKPCTRFETCTPIECLVEVCTNGQRASVVRKNKPSEAENGHFKSCITFEPGGIFQPVQ